MKLIGLTVSPEFSSWVKTFAIDLTRVELSPIDSIAFFA